MVDFISSRMARVSWRVSSEIAPDFHRYRSQSIVSRSANFDRHFSAAAICDGGGTGLLRRTSFPPSSTNRGFA